MKKILGVVLAAFCLCSGCGSAAESGQASDSSATEAVETAAGSQESAVETGKKLTAATVAVKPVEITEIGLRYSAEGPLTIDLEEKRGTFAAYVEADGFVSKDRFRIYSEPENLVEISDIEVKKDGLINFYVTGKTAGSGELFIATEDGSLVSQPVELLVRSAEEKEQDEKPVYYTALGEYWHFSDECAREDYPEKSYDWKGNAHEIDTSSIRVMETTQGHVFGDKKPCPKCAAEDGEQGE